MQAVCLQPKYTYVGWILERFEKTPALPLPHVFTCNTLSKTGPEALRLRDVWSLQNILSKVHAHLAARWTSFRLASGPIACAESPAVLVLFATASLTDNRTSVQSHSDNIYVTEACGNLGLEPTQVNRCRDEQ